MGSVVAAKPEEKKGKSTVHEPASVEGTQSAQAVGIRAGLPLFLQRAGASSGGPSPLHSDGSRAGEMPFPFADRILRATGTSLRLRSVCDAGGCAGRGTPAFTDGMTTHFGSQTPSLHVAAHEAAHQLQHAGLTRDADLGPEGHAGAVADAISSGGPPAALIGNHGAPVSSAIRNYQLTDRAGRWKGVSPGAVFAKLSETGEAFTAGGQTAFATPALINSANGLLTAKQSGVIISPGAGAMTVEAPDNSGSKTLSKVDVKFAADPTGKKFYGDCRQASREVMGPSSTRVPEEAMCSPGGTPAMVPGNPLDLVAKTLFLDQRIRDTPNYDPLTPEEKNQVAKKAAEDFENLSPEEKDKLRKSKVTEEAAKRMGIDQFAQPGVGEAFASFRGDKAPLGQFGFHYATVIMVAGEDRVTLENAGGDPDQLTAKWLMEMYGPASKNQTFQEEHENLGQNVHTLRLGTMPSPPSGAADLPSLPTRELIRRLKDSADSSEQSYLKLELGRRSILAWVEVVKKKSWILDDDVFVLFGGGAMGLGHSTGTVSIGEGQSNVFAMPVMSIWPVPDPLVIAVHELGPPDHSIGSVVWPAPYTHQYLADLTAGSAHYTLQVSM
ncbi:MAG: hypothetical protein ACLP59_21260 [Bryobacteraceae bacterium]